MSDTVQLFADAWKLMVGRLPQGMVREDDGVVSCLGNVPLSLLNLSIIERPTQSQDELHALLEIAAGHAADCSFPTTVLLREDWLPAGWEEVASEARLAPMVPITGMDAESLLAPQRPTTNLDIRRVADEKMASDLARLNALAYGMAPDAFDCVADMRFWHPESYACVGYDEGRPVCCASALPVNGTVYIALVATLPEEQGKGYGEAVTRQAVIQGQKTMRVTRTTLHASDMGLPVYRRMGYRPGPRLVILGSAHQ